MFGTLCQQFERSRGTRRKNTAIQILLGFPSDSDGKESTHNAGNLGSIPVLGRSPEEGNGYPLQYSCLVNSMDRGAWWATVHGVAKSRTRLSDFTSLHFFTFCHKSAVICISEVIDKTAKLPLSFRLALPFHNISPCLLLNLLPLTIFSFKV